MNIVKLHQLIDTWAAEERASENPAKGLDTSQVDTSTVEEARVLPEGQRVARTKSSGDRVYLLDDNKKTRQWVTTPEILKGLGFESGDVIEVDENEFLKYQMSAAIYKMPDVA